MGQQITDDYRGHEVHVVCILNGAFMFAADLVRQIHLPCYLHFLKVSSYKGTESTGQIQQVLGLTASLQHKHVIIAEDIVDTGATMQFVHAAIHQMGPASLKVASLLLKPDAYKGEVKIDYLCHSIPNRFVVGYGLDYDGLGRNLEDIYQLKS